MSIERIHTDIDNYTYDQAKIGTEYVVSRRSDNRVTVGWSSHLDLGKTLINSRNLLGEPISHMNGRLAQYRWPDHPTVKGVSENDMPVPDILAVATQEPDRILYAQLPFDGMAVVWAKVMGADKDILVEPFQVQITAEQKISRAALFGIMLDTASPALVGNLSEALTALECDFQPRTRGDVYKSDEWQAMHKPQLG